MNGQPYSRNTFEAFAKERHYVSVRLKQGVPLVDADINELEDLRRYELRNFLRWFVGDGTPNANTGFRIMPSGAPNDVLIMGGDGTPEGGGRCLVDGMEVLNHADIRFSAQEFSDAAAAGRAGVPQVTMPATPALGERTDLYYLDVWEREVSSAEDGHQDIVDGRIGIESARRIRREWAVRVVDAGAGLPANDTPPGHRYLALARVLRTAGQDVITDGSIVDLRRRGVLMPARTTFDQITTDAFGSSYALGDDGLPKLALPLREVINAMLRDGGRPAIVEPPPEPIPNGPPDYPSGAIEANGDQWLFWVRPPATGETDGEIRYRRQIGGQWQPNSELFRTAAGSSLGVKVLSDTAGRIWVFWQEMRGAAFLSNIFGRRFQNNSWGDEFNVTQNASSAVFIDELSVAINDADQVMVVWRQDATQFRSRTVSANLSLSSIRNVPAQLRAGLAAVNVDNRFTLFGLDVDVSSPPATPVAIHRTQWNGSAWSAPVQVGTVSNSGPFELAAAPDRFGGVWLFYSNGQLSLTGRYLAAGASAGDERVLAQTTGLPNRPGTVVDPQSNIQVLFHLGDTDFLQRLMLVTRV